MVGEQINSSPFMENSMLVKKDNALLFRKVSLLEEQFWKRKCCIKEELLGDRNSKYFLANLKDKK